MSLPLPRLVARSPRRAILATRIAAATGIAVLLSCATPARATVGAWNVDLSDIWSNSADWNPAVPPGLAAGDTANLTFNITTATRTITIDGAVSSRTVGILSIGDTNNTNAFALAASGGGKLIFDNGASAATLTATSTSFGDTISAPIVLNSALNITNSSSTKTLTIGGGITAGSAGTKTITIAAGSAAGNAVTISGIIAVGSGDIAIVKNSADNLILSGGNSFTGGVTLNTGTLTLNNATALGAAASTLTINGGTVAGSVTMTANNAQAWNGDFAFGGASSLNMGTGAVTMSASRTITIGGSSNTFTVGGVIGEASAGLSLNTANATGDVTSTLVLSGTNTYTGGTNINGGVLRFNTVAAIPATGLITIQSGGALSVFGAHATLATWLSDSHLSTASTGALALTAANSEAFNPGALDFNTISLGSSLGGSFAYTGTYTPGASGYFAGGGGGTIIFSNTNAFTGANNLTVGNGGGGTVVVSATNNISGQVMITNGSLQIGNGAATGSLDGVSAIVDNGDLIFNRSDDITFSVPISGTGSLTKLGAGKVTIATSAYTGATVLGAGTLVFAADPANSTSLTFGATLGGTSAANLDLSSVNATYGSLAVQTNTATVNTITVSSGKTLTVNGAVSIGYNLGTVATNLTATNKLTITGGGSLVVTNAAAIFNVGVSQTTQLTNATSSTLDLTGLSSVTLGNATTAISALQVGFGQTAAGTLLLSNTANLVTATTISIGHSNGLNGGGGTLTLGTGTNVLHADTINIGLSKTAGTIAFASPSDGPGSVTIANKAGSGAATLVVGSQNGTGTAGVLTGTLDLRGHTATVNAGTVTVGNNNNAGSSGSASGIIDFDTGTFNATSLSLGLKSSTGTGSNTGNFVNVDGGTFAVSGATAMSAHSGSAAGNVTSTLAVTGGSFTTATLTAANKTAAGAGSAIGFINVSGGSLTVTGATFTLATQATAGTAAGTLAITGGLVTSNANILDGGGSTTTTITLDGGTLDLKNHNIGSATPIDALNFQSGTLQNVAQINNGTTGLTKTAGAGTNTLILAGTNAYTGATTVSAGTLLVNGAITGSTVAVSAGTLGGTGAINLSAAQSVAVGAATLAPGAGLGELKVVGGNGVSFAASSTFSIETGAAGASDKLTITGTTGNLDLSTATDLLSLTSTDPGTFTIASWTGTRSGFFDLVTINGASETYTVGTAGNVTTYTLDSGDGSIVYDDDNKRITVLVTVPEPGSIVSLLGGLGLLTSLQRFRRRR